MDERQENRDFVRISATGVSTDGLERVPVFIVDLSRTGAKVEFSQPPTDICELLFNHRAEPCETKWREGQLIGVEFIN